MLDQSPNRDLALLGCLLIAGVGLPAAVFVVLGVAAAWQAGLVLMGVLAACYALLSLALAAPVPALIAGSVLAFSTARGLWSASRQLRQTRRCVRPLLALAGQSARLSEACERAGVDPDIVLEVAADRQTCFSCGLVRRRIIVTSALVAGLKDDELAAVLAHEETHVRSFDPARMLAARCASHALLWLPVAADLRDRFLIAKELAADRVAIDRCGTKALGSALLKLSDPGPAGTAAFGGGMLNVRVDALLGEPVGMPSLSRRRLALTAAAIAGEVGLVAWATQAASDARPAPPSVGAILPMLQSPTVHGLAGMAAITAVNLLAIAVGHRVFRSARRESRTR